jgi:integrase
MHLEAVEGRSQVWTTEQIETVIDGALNGGKAKSGNKIPARSSIALAVMIAYDTSLPQQYILALKWELFDGKGLTVIQIKKRGGRELYLPLRQRTINQLRGIVHHISGHIIISEETGQPYCDSSQEDNRVKAKAFSRIFRKFRERAGVVGLTFHDIRRTALTELGNRGATNTEIAAWSGHAPGSKILSVYVKPDKSASMNAFKKRGD